MLDIAAPRFLVRPMAAGPPALLELLRLGKGRFGGHEDFVGSVLHTVQARRTRGTQRGDVRTLTEREEVILRDLPSLLSLHDIAAAHHVTENTVKTHVRSIYDKLGVHSRRQAVARANELGLI
jgi:LuxR family transcriptional regulator, maltose regulon positive regulatory protein